MSNWSLDKVFATPGGAVRWSSLGVGEPIVLLHGTPFSSLVWREIALALAASRRVYVWDMLGFGQSDKEVGQDVSLATQAQIFAALLDRWGTSSPSVVAHDVGGVVALRAALIEGVRFSDLTLVDAVSVSGWSDGGFFRTVKDNAGVFMQLPDYAHEALVTSKIRDGSYLGLRNDVVDSFVRPWKGPEGKSAFYRQYEQADEAHSDEFQAKLDSLAMPTKILWGREDRWINADYAERLRSQLPSAQFHWIEDCGHIVQHDAPARLLRHLMAGHNHR